MKKKRIVGVMCVVFITIMATNVMPVLAADADGCWSGRHRDGSCLEYRTYVKDNKTYFKLTNVCADRLYIRWCANDRCGADGLRGGQTKTKYEYVTNATTKTWATGSNKSLKDWVCAGKAGGLR